MVETNGHAPSAESRLADQDLKLKEIALKEAELRLKDLELRRSWRTSIAVAVITGAVALGVAAVGALVQARSNMQLEQERLRASFESSLILKAIETGDPEVAKRNLLFFVQIGFLSDPSGKITQLAKAEGQTPVLPAVNPTVAVGNDAQPHFWLTLELAQLAGFEVTDALELARYDQNVDEDPETSPLFSVDARAKFHFPTDERVRELRTRALNCSAGPRITSDEFRAVGQLLHAVKDQFFHKGFGAVFGHAFAGSVPDRPWSNHEGFGGMFTQVFEELLVVRGRCLKDSFDERSSRDRFLQAKALVDEWMKAELTAGLGNPNSRARWDRLMLQLHTLNLNRANSK